MKFKNCINIGYNAIRAAAVRGNATFIGSNIDIPIFQLSVNGKALNARAMNALKVLGCKTVRDVLNLTDEQILSVPNTGKLALNQIKQALKEV